MKKQLQLMLFSVFMLLISVSSYSQNSQIGKRFENNNIRYRITNSNPPKVRIEKYVGTATEVDIPPRVSHNGISYSVDAIGSKFTHEYGRALRPFENKRLTRVTIPNTVTYIGIGAFKANRLTEITIPANVSFIREHAFFRNPNLSIVKINSNPPRNIDPKAFMLENNDYGFVNLVVPFDGIESYKNNVLFNTFKTITAGITTIDKVIYAVIDSPDEATVIGHDRIGFHMQAPETVDIDGKSYPVTAVADKAFENYSIETASLPPTIKRIGSRAFRTGTLRRFTVDAHEPPTFHPDTFSPFVKTKALLIVPKGSESAYLRAGWAAGFKDMITLVGQTHLFNRFYYKILSIRPYEALLVQYEDLSQQEVVILPEVLYHPNQTTYTVTAIGEKAFNRLPTLIRVFIPNTVKSIGDKAFSGKQLLKIDLPDILEHIGSEAFFDNDLNGLVLPESVTSIGARAFAKNQLKEVTIPNGITSIERGTFAENQLTKITIPTSVQSMGERAFSNNQLTTVITPINVKAIKDLTYSTNQLTEVTISSNVESIGQGAFANNPQLHLVRVEANNPPVLHRGAFFNTDRDRIDLVVPFGKKQPYLDSGWDGFKSILFGIFTADGIVYGITSLDKVMAIDYVATATAITVPKTVDHDGNTYEVTAMGQEVFFNNEMTGVEIPSSITNIRQSAFSQNNLQSFDIPENVTSMGLRAFAGNQLTEVTIPNGVTSIEQGIFAENRLTEVTIPHNVSVIKNNAFANNPQLHLVKVEANNPPLLEEEAFKNPDRNLIDLVVPLGKLRYYLDNGWQGFRSIADGSSPLQPIIDGPQNVSDSESFTVNITFDGEVRNFNASDIQVANATIKDFTGGGSRYTVTLAHELICEGGNITIDVPANMTFGVNSLSYLAAQQISVSVIETTPPTITCPRDVKASTFTDATGNCTTTVALKTPVTADNCSSTTVVAQVNGADIDTKTYAFGLGATTVTWIVTDEVGNTASCDQTVTVEESLENLTVLTKNITVELDIDGHAKISPEDIDNGSFYGCNSTPSLSLDIHTFDCRDVGEEIFVTLTASQSGYSDIGMAIVTVKENENNVVAEAIDITVHLDANGQATILPQNVDGGSFYGCDQPPVLRLDKDSFSCDDIGEVTVTLTASHGDIEDTATAIVTVVKSEFCRVNLLTNLNRGISPNGDGIGDTLIIKGLEQYENNEVKIYDLSQRLLFSTHYNGPGDAWDGTHKGRRVPVGSYVCVIDYNEPGLDHEAKMIYVNY